MPVWHAQLDAARKAGKVELIGVIQEQHAERCRLYAQWRQFDWPILHDPINRLQLQAVPVPVAIDEHGVVRHVGIQPEAVDDQFLSVQYARPASNSPSLATASKPDLTQLTEIARGSASEDAWLDLGDACILWGSGQNLDQAVAAYRKCLQIDAANHAAAFRLGVAFRMRSETPFRQDSDFQSAIRNWQLALDLDPNHYIYRRRIQQYGPRLSKPYPFYDWIPRARAELLARGVSPIELPVEPTGSEFASPLESEISKTEVNPDPAGRILRDSRPFVQISRIIVPSRIKPGESGRVHLEFRVDKGVHWNNESERLRVWIDAPRPWKLEQPLLSAPRAELPESSETRRVDFEIHAPTDFTGSRTWRGYALYYICEDAGQCLFRRQDFEFVVESTENLTKP